MISKSHGKREKSPNNLRRKTSYLRPPSKKIKFNFNQKLGETKKNTKKYVQPFISSPVINETASLTLDTKTITSAIRKHYVKNIAEAIDNPKDIQFALKQYWNNLPTAEKEHFSQSSPSIRVNETFLLL